ncbi:MAG: ATP synthase F1 subunit delta [Firmicutes bacterium]|nr:ATP synthase F1 subunit delta [Bacillota bacterium]
MTPVAKMYGGSLYDLASEENKAAEILEQVDMVNGLFRENPDYLRLLSTPAISKKERCGLIDEAFRGQVDGYLLNFLKILCENGTLNELSGCTREMRSRYNADNGIVEAVATAAIPLSDAQQEALRKRLAAITGRKICLECKVDPSVLGGIRLDMEGTRLDGTVESRISALRAEIAGIVL